MADERRYDEDEVSLIFEEASRVGRSGSGGSGSHALSSGSGLTLEELQDIAREVGLPPERVADAARALDTRARPVPRRTYAGVPVSVGRTVELPRAPTDREWELLVAELRETFGARGKLSGRGGLREWSNGNLHALVEPTEDGHRLRMGTLKGSAMQYGASGVALLGIGLVLLVVMLLAGRAADALFAPMFLAALGTGFLGSQALTLPRWAREREEQMEYIAGRARALIPDESEAE